MNYILLLNTFFERIADDDRITPTHISLYMALFQVWNANRFQNPINISRSSMMKASKIHAKATYHKAIKELVQWGYINYNPSYNPFKGSAIHMIVLQTGRDNSPPQNSTATIHTIDSYCTKTCTPTVPINEPYTNNTKTGNNKIGYEQSNENTSSNFSGDGEQADTANQLQERKQTTEAAAMPVARNLDKGRPASLQQVQLFFENEKSTMLEAQKFFNHFQSNGWKVGGRSPMKDWQAAARNWMLNQNKFTTTQSPSRASLTKEKNYAEPL